jgi:hypothetical protein
MALPCPHAIISTESPFSWTGRFFSEVIGWALGRSLKAKLPLFRFGASRCEPQVAAGSCPSFRSTCAVLVSGIDERLRHHGMLPSMTRPANPYDNATCESFLKTLKRASARGLARRHRRMKCAPSRRFPFVVFTTVHLSSDLVTTPN